MFFVVIVGIVAISLATAFSVIGATTGSSSYSGPSVQPTTTRPTPAGTTTRPVSTQTNPTVRIHPSGSPYVNDTYSAPAPVQTVDADPNDPSADVAEKNRSGNPLYAQKVAKPVRCAQDPITATMTQAQQQERANAFIGCLMTAWEPALRAIGKPLPRPRVLYFTGSIQTACGTVDYEHGLYCPSSMTIYMTPKKRDYQTPAGLVAFTVEDVLSHEFGHHVQTASRISAGSWFVQYTKRGTPGYNEENRRMELQAQCFGGAGLAAVATSTGMTQVDFDYLNLSWYNADPDETHGTGPNYAGWQKRGWQSTSIGKCNTYLAPATEVA